MIPRPWRASPEVDLAVGSNLWFRGHYRVKTPRLQRTLNDVEREGSEIKR